MTDRGIYATEAADTTHPIIIKNPTRFLKKYTKQEWSDIGYELSQWGPHFKIIKQQAKDMIASCRKQLTRCGKSNFDAFLNDSFRGNHIDELIGDAGNACRHLFYSPNRDYPFERGYEPYSPELVQAHIQQTFIPRREKLLATISLICTPKYFSPRIDPQIILDDMRDKVLSTAVHRIITIVSGHSIHNRGRSASGKDVPDFYDLWCGKYTIKEWKKLHDEDEQAWEDQRNHWELTRKKNARAMVEALYDHYQVKENLTAGVCTRILKKLPFITNAGADKSTWSKPGQYEVGTESSRWYGRTWLMFLMNLLKDADITKSEKPVPCDVHGVFELFEKEQVA